VIKLERPQGTLGDQAFFLSSFYGSLKRGKEDERNDWKNYTRMILAVYEEGRRLKTEGLERKYGLDILDIERLDKTDREFLKRYEK